MRRSLLTLALLVGGPAPAVADPVLHRVLVVRVRPAVEAPRWHPDPVADVAADPQRAMLADMTIRAWHAVGWRALHDPPTLSVGARDGGLQLKVSWHF